MKKYFTKVTCLEELYQKFKKDSIQQNKKLAKKTAFKKYFKTKFGKKLGFKKNHLDVCQICTKIHVFQQKLQHKSITIHKNK